MTNTLGLRVAVVDDEVSLRETVALALRRAGYDTAVHADGQEAWERFQSALPDLVILDILMPRMDGLELCRRLRGRSEVLPILFLTSKDEELDRVLGLEIGADDYLCKPFSVRELVARVKVLLRRRALIDGAVGTPAENVLEVGKLVMDLDRFTATWLGTELVLTVTEFRILQSLAKRPGHVRTRDQLVRDGYPEDNFVSDRTIDSHIKRLRRKLEDADESFDAIETVYGLGYRFHDR
jgi:DNA-binding response OmpR family regulator